MSSLTRRWALKIFGMGTSLLGLGATKTVRAAAQAEPKREPLEQWHKTHDRVWLGESVWANPMEDWRIKDGAAECLSTGGDRNIHSITHQIANEKGEFSTTVLISQVEVKKSDGGAGFRIGVNSDIGEHRANCFTKRGITAGVADGKLVLGRQSVPLDKNFDAKQFRLTLNGEPSESRYALTLSVTSPDGKTTFGEKKLSVPAESVVGNIALVCNLDPSIKKGRGARYRFQDWRAGGDAIEANADRKFGPILWSMYSLSDSRTDDGFVLKLSALTGPLGKNDHRDVELQVQRKGKWTSLGKAELDNDAWTATFRIANWTEKENVPYKLIYREKHTDGTSSMDEWQGKIRQNPSDRPLRIGALTCQNAYAFPYEPVAENLLKLDPDMLYFSGDQLYENHGGYGVIRDPAGPAILNYLRKYYMFGWAFREAMRDRPTLCIPDDHDVFQGNIWGEGGAPMKGIAQGASSKGGYREPARMVNVVHKTNCSHHPDYYDATPVAQGISVYYGDMVYGDVSFAILGDRQFKSGPERVCTWEGRADHVKDESIDVKSIDKEGLELLGKRQEKFVAEWAKDWRGHTMKVLLSQTVFAAVATHHGGYNGYLKADLDSGGWPQTPRDNAINLMRPGMPLHINGDQHLTTLVQYGADKQRDSSWSFCTPAIAVGYPRWWRPDEIGMKHANRPKHGNANTGEFVDGFGNLVYVYAVGNPIVPNKKNRYEKAHQKGSGFGFVTIDTEKKTYFIESFRFLVDPSDGKKENQFPGWPVTIHQKENKGENELS